MEKNMLVCIFAGRGENCFGVSAVVRSSFVQNDPFESFSDLLFLWLSLGN